MQQNFGRLQQSNDVYNTVPNCMSYKRNSGTNLKQRKLRQFSLVSALTFVAIDILGPLQNIETGNKHMVVITDRYCKLNEVIPTTKTMASRIANIFMEYWVAISEIPSIVPTDNSSQFTSKLFAALCVEPGASMAITNGNHPQTIGQVECLNETMI